MAGAKVTPRAKKPRHVVERNIALLGNLTKYLLAEPQVFNLLPDNFELVILPDDDPAVRLYNLELLDTYGSEGKPVVFVRMRSSKETDLRQEQPSLYVPLAV